MHPAAKKCIQWSIGLFIVGAVLLVYTPGIYGAIDSRAGANAEIGMGAVSLGLTLLRWTLMPVGAALIGAAVVIQVLSGEMERRVGGLDHHVTDNS